MRTKTFILSTVMMAMLPLSSAQVWAMPVNINLQVRYDDPNLNKGNQNKTPLRMPQVGIDGHTLLFNTSCDGCQLQVVDGAGSVVYVITIPDDTDTLILPSTLSGEYTLQIIRGNWCFFGTINL